MQVEPWTADTPFCPLTAMPDTILCDVMSLVTFHGL